MIFKGYRLAEYRGNKINKHMKLLESHRKNLLMSFPCLVVSIILGVLFLNPEFADSHIIIFLVIMLFLMLTVLLAMGEIIFFIKEKFIISELEENLLAPSEIIISEDGKIKLHKKGREEYRIDRLKSCTIDPIKQLLIIKGLRHGVLETIEVDQYLEGYESLVKILEMFMSMQLTKGINNETFKDLIEITQHNPTGLLMELKELKYVFPIYFHIDSKPKSNDYYVIDNNLLVSYQVKIVEDKKYICVYSGVDNIIDNPEYPRRILKDYSFFEDLVMNNTLDSDLFIRDKEQLMGIIINPEKEHIILKMR